MFDLTPLVVVAAMAAVDQRHQEWKYEISVAASELAEREDWCATFDAFMYKHGLLTRAQIALRQRQRRYAKQVAQGKPLGPRQRGYLASAEAAVAREAENLATDYMQRRMERIP